MCMGATGGPRSPIPHHHHPTTNEHAAANGEPVTPRRCTFASSPYIRASLVLPLMSLIA